MVPKSLTPLLSPPGMKYRKISNCFTCLPKCCFFFAEVGIWAPLHNTGARLQFNDTVQLDRTFYHCVKGKNYAYILTSFPTLKLQTFSLHWQGCSPGHTVSWFYPILCVKINKATAHRVMSFLWLCQFTLVSVNWTGLPWTSQATKSAQSSRHSTLQKAASFHCSRN